MYNPFEVERPILPKFTFLTAIALCGVLAFAVPSGNAKRHPKRSSVKPAKKTQQIRSTQNQLEKVKAEIVQYQSELRKHEKLEAKSKKNIHAFEKRTAQLRATIDRLEAEVEELTSEKAEVDESLHQTANTLDALKNAYAKSSRYLYTHGALAPQNSDIYLFAPEQQEMSTRMSYYTQTIGEAHAMNRTRLDSMKRTLGASSLELQHSLTAEEQRIGQSAQQATTLEEKKREEAKQLAQIQIKKDRLKQLLKERTASAKKLEGIIANLVASEEKAKRAETRNKTNKRHRKNEPELANDAATGRAYGPHSLQWPSSSHHVVQGFGEHRNAEIGTVTMNLGIDISSPQGSSVVASAEGEVSLVASLPSYGTIVVLKHSGGLHTVYADLSGASVKKGTHIRTGQQVGRSGTNEENGAVLHFEVWKGKSKQNPMGWLR